VGGSLTRHRLRRRDKGRENDVRKLLTLLVILTLTVPLAVPVAAKEKAMEPQEVTEARRCFALVNQAIRVLDRKSEGKASLPDCGTVERSTTVTPKGDLLVMSGQRICQETRHVNLYRVTTVRLTTCENFEYDGSRITYFDTPPITTCWTSIGWECASSSAGAAWRSQPWEARAWSSTQVKQTAFGWTIGMITINHVIYFRGDGSWN
jgi:hypothetical protein